MTRHKWLIPNFLRARRLHILSGASGHGDLAPYADHVIDSIADLEALLDRL